MREGNGNPLQYSCLESTVDKGASWAAVHGVAQSWTWLKRLSMHACIGEGNGNPLQCSCLENPRDKEARWAAIYGVAQSQTRLKRFSSSSSNSRGYNESYYWHMRLSIFKYKVMLLTKVNHKVIVQIYIPANNIYQSYCLYSSIMELFY